MNALLEFNKLEALVAGTLSAVFELIIWNTLIFRKRTLWYYHQIPIINGMFLILLSVDDANIPLNVISTMISIATSLNVYNTYYVHVVMMADYVENIKANEQIIDIFLPRYKKSFFPYGPIVQSVYSAFVIFHCIFRAYMLGYMIEKKIGA